MEGCRGRGWKVVERNVPKMSTLTVKGSGEERDGEREWGRVEGGEK